MGPVDIILILIIAGAVFLAFRSVIRKRKNGGCSCGCADCPSSQKSRISGSKTPPSESSCPFCSTPGKQDQTSV